jgi:hypothetical protein
MAKPLSTRPWVKSQSLTCFAPLVSLAYAPRIWASPRALVRANAAAAQPLIPRRDAALRRLAVVRRRPAKGRSLHSFGGFWFWSYHVEERAGSPP